MILIDDSLWLKMREIFQSEIFDSIRSVDFLNVPCNLQYEYNNESNYKYYLISIWLIMEITKGSIRSTEGMTGTRGDLREEMSHMR